MRHLLALLVFLLSAGAALAVDGTAMPGGDYDDFSAPSAAACRGTCDGEPRCQASSFVKPGAKSPAGHCWLKDSQPASVSDPCCDSALRDVMPDRSARFEAGTNRPGLDFRNLFTADAATCASACAGSAGCAAWSFVRPGGAGPGGRCWLKSRVARPVAEGNAVSGVTFSPPARHPD